MVQSGHLIGCRRCVVSQKPTSTRKVTVSLPESLVDFADREAERLNTSRSHVIARAIAESKVAYEADLAAEGYKFFAREARGFAEASASAVAEAWGNGC
jgi:predicted transcriptional regulator